MSANAGHEGGFLNSTGGALVSGLGIAPTKITGFFQNNPWAIPVAAAAATMFTGGAAAPLAAGAIGAGEAGAGTAAGLGAAGAGAAAGAGTAAGLGALDAGAAGAGAAGGLLGGSAGAIAPITAEAPMAMDAPFGMMGAGVNPYVGGSNMFSTMFGNLQSNLGSRQMMGMGTNMLSKAMQPQQPSPMGMQRPMGMQQQPSQPTSISGMLNQPAQGVTGGSNDVLARMRALGLI